MEYNRSNGDRVSQNSCYSIPVFILHSSESNEIFNDIEIIVDIDCMTFKFPHELGIENKKYYYKKGEKGEGIVLWQNN